MAFLYHWVWSTYEKDMAQDPSPADLTLQQNAAIFGTVEHGDRIWAFTRRPDKRYVLVAQYRADDARAVNDPEAYGRWEAPAMVGTTVMYDPAPAEDVEPVIRKLSIKTDATVLGHSFQGPGAVRQISDADDVLLEAFAVQQPVLAAAHAASVPVGLLSKLTDPDAVLEAVAECDTIGRKAFLKKYGFGPAREYFLLRAGRYYDSKAVAGAAFGYQHPKEGPLGANDFSGGELTVQPALERLGFTVVRVDRPEVASTEPLVLVENEVTYEGTYDHWQDLTGVRYHFPNQYRNKIWTGRRFLYYRGVRRKEGARGTAEYFGTGVIGEVERDPTVPEDAPRNKWRWYCDIEEYTPFSHPVPSKHDGKYFEAMSTPLDWRTAVRVLPEATSEAILRVAGAATTARDASPSATSKTKAGPVAVPIDQVSPSVADGLQGALIPRSKTGKKQSKGTAFPRHTRSSKFIGDRAEEVVYRFLRSSLPPQLRETVRWVADAGEQPGWDVEYKDGAGNLVAVEVKGTTAGAFASVDVTANEWQQAEAMGGQYWLFLVTNCLNATPKIWRVQNPFATHQAGTLFIAVTGWRLTFSG